MTIKKKIKINIKITQSKKRIMNDFYTFIQYLQKLIAKRKKKL